MATFDLFSYITDTFQDFGRQFNGAASQTGRTFPKHFETHEEGKGSGKPTSSRVMSRRRSHSPSPSRTCSSSDPRDLERRIFVGNLPTSDMEKKDLEELFGPYGKIIDDFFVVDLVSRKKRQQ
ncbi:hypothetical protein EYF80_013360 [Liparis tanakae]|uniref:RRM domain-containing protein n=1 Tax=Liparis tanakae TaxID=230148 RepID=A0A4Z2IFT9_9TELE|nr:hypothetical protein EYF80_013360 [Liparis tanakae]